MSSESLKKELKNLGYTVQSPKGKGKTTYYVKKDERYAVVFVFRKGKEYVLIVEHAVFRQLRYPSIFLDKKKEGLLVPCIQIGVGVWRRIHNLIIPVENERHVDHTNHNRFFCTKSNLRSCTPEENASNKMRYMDEYPFETKKMNNGVLQYSYKLPILLHKQSVISVMSNRGFSKCSQTIDWVIMKSPAFQSKVDCYIHFRDSSRILYQGTRMEKFIYDIENDFSVTMDLLIRYYIFHEITEKEMYQMNLDYWRHKLDGTPMTWQYKYVPY